MPDESDSRVLSSRLALHIAIPQLPLLPAFRPATPSGEAGREFMLSAVEREFLIKPIHHQKCCPSLAVLGTLYCGII
jgi:hypothetical protein